MFAVSPTHTQTGEHVRTRTVFLCVTQRQRLFFIVPVNALTTENNTFSLHCHLFDQLPHQPCDGHVFGVHCQLGE